MSQYLVPTDSTLVEAVAKAIAKNRMQDEAIASLKGMLGLDTSLLEKLVEPTVDRIFETLWSGTDCNDVMQRDMYRRDAIAAINTINLKLITSIE